MLRFVRLDDVFLRSGDDGRDGEEERPEKQAFAFVHNRRLEATGELDEPKDHGRSYSKEKEEIDNEEDCTNGEHTGEGMRLDRNERCDASRGHGESVPSPCEVPKPLSER